MTNSKVDPLTLLRGSTHYALADGTVALPGRTCWIWDGTYPGKHNDYHSLFNRMCRKDSYFGQQEIAFEVYDDEL